MPERNEHSAALSVDGIIDACGKAWADNWKAAYVTLGLDCVRPWWGRMGLELSSGAEDMVQAAARKALEELVKNGICVEFFDPDYDKEANRKILSAFVEQTRHGLDEKHHRHLLEWAAFDYCTEGDNHIFESVWHSTLMNIRHRNIDPGIIPPLDKDIASAVERIVATHVTPDVIRVPRKLEHAVRAPDTAWDRFALEHAGGIDDTWGTDKTDHLISRICIQTGKIQFRHIWAELRRSLSQAQLENLYAWHKAFSAKREIWPDHIRYPRAGPPRPD